jgi:uncharacterized protein YdbL (DUF1318 family)
MRDLILAALFAVFSLTPALTRAAGEDLALSAMKERVPALVKAKDAGQIGEKRDGLVGLVSESAPAAVKALVEEENKNRLEVYKARAAEQGQDLEVFMRVMGDSRVDNEKSGRFVQKFDGSWAKKN